MSVLVEPNKLTVYERVLAEECKKFPKVKQPTNHIEFKKTQRSNHRINTERSVNNPRTELSKYFNEPLDLNKKNIIDCYKLKIVEGRKASQSPNTHRELYHSKLQSDNKKETRNGSALGISS